MAGRPNYCLFLDLFSFAKVSSAAIIMAAKPILSAVSCDAPSETHIKVVKDLARKATAMISKGLVKLNLRMR